MAVRVEQTTLQSRRPNSDHISLRLGGGEPIWLAACYW